jgi:glycine betaine/proline transport system permease protein
MTVSSDISVLAEFVEHNPAYYSRVFQHLGQRRQFFSLNIAALLAGPLWAAARRVWGLFWFGLLGELLAIILAGRALVTREMDPGAIGADWPAFLAALGFFSAIRLVLSLTANAAYLRRYERWRIDNSIGAGFGGRPLLAGLGLLLAIYPLSIYRFWNSEVPPELAAFPAAKGFARATANGISALFDWMTIRFEAFFDAVTAVIRLVLNHIDFVFVTTPWPVTGFVILLIAWRLAGWRVGLFTLASLAYLGLFGFWEKSMSTLALVVTSVAIILVFAMPLGIWCAKSRRVEAILYPVLDAMQTLPTFVYLIPAIAFFSIGKTPGVIATVIFAMPPMIKLTALGIRQVPGHIVEAAVAYGGSPAQILFKVELPLAKPAIMTGLNQTIMMSLSMVVIAALIGAGGLGEDVTRALQFLQKGQGILAGLAIVLCAMVIDRVLQGVHDRNTRHRDRNGNP